MARQIHWHFAFVGMNNKRYDVNIYDENYTGAVVELTPAAEPFTTDNDNDGDPLQPSCISTGYIRVINRGDLDGLMPTTDTEHYVEVVEDSLSLKNQWFGFMQAVQFERDAYLINDEVEYPVHDILGALGSLNLETNKKKIDDNNLKYQPTFAELIVEALSQISVIPGIMYPKEWSGANDSGQDSGKYYGWMMLRTNRNNFAEEDDRVSYLEVLESIATFMGWTLCMNGSRVAFISHNTTDYATLSMTQMRNLSFSVREANTSLAHNWNVADLLHVSTGNTLETIRGYSEVKIDSDVKPVDQIDLGIDFEGGKFAGEINEVDAFNRMKTKHLVFDASTSKTMDMYAYEVEAEDDRYCRADSDNYEPCINQTVKQKHGDPLHNFYIDPQIEKYDQWLREEEESGEKYNYNFTHRLVIYINLPRWSGKSGGQDEPRLLLNATRLFALKGGKLAQQHGGCLDFIFKCASMMPGIIRGVLRIGDKYFSGTEWVNTRVMFEFNCTPGGVKRTKTLSMPYDGGEGLIIPLPDDVFGDVTFELYTGPRVSPSSTAIYPTDHLHIDFPWYITDLKFTYHNGITEQYEELDDNSKYSDKVDNKFADTKEVSLAFTTKRPEIKNGLSTLVYRSDIFQEGHLYYNGAAAIPEKVLLGKMKDAYTRSLDLLTITVRLDQIQSIGEWCNWNGKRWNVISRNINWRDSTVTLKMLNLQND